MRILLTGCNGMVGSWLTEQLSVSHHTVCATSKGSNRLPLSFFHDRVTHCSLDITNVQEVESMFQSFHPDLIIHGAAMTQVDECEQKKSICFKVNVEGTEHLLKAAGEINARFCYLSTDFVFSGEDGPYKETDQTAPVNYYGQTKELAELHVMNSGLHWCIIRTILLYGKKGAMNRSSFIHWVKENLEANHPLQVVHDQIRTPTYIPDLVNGILLAAEKGAQGIFHISGLERYTPYEMALCVANHLQLNTDLLQPVDASTFSQIGKRPQKTGFSIEKARKSLGYTPTPFIQALHEIF